MHLLRCSIMVVDRLNQFTKAELTSMLNALVKQSITNMVVDENLESAKEKVVNLLQTTE